VHYGRIKMIDHARRFSFIKPDQACSYDAFLHFNVVRASGINPDDLQVDQAVRYEVEASDRQPGRFKATRVELI
jgi:cold shock CspA family protein